jgi:hypothetical protein
MMLRQQNFVAALLGPAKGVGTLAARLAGYKGDRRQLAVQACRLLRNREVQKLMREKLEELYRRGVDMLGEALDATKCRPFLSSGGIVYSEREPDYPVQLKAFDRIHKLYESSGRTGEPIHPPVIIEGSAQVSDQAKQTDASDRALIRATADIDERLSELERELSEEEK